MFTNANILKFNTDNLLSRCVRAHFIVILPLLCCACLYTSSTFAGTPSKLEITRRINELSTSKVLRSSTGDFVVYGTNRIQNLKVMAWARKISAHIEKTIGAKMPSSSQAVQIVLRGKTDPSHGPISAKEKFLSGQLLQSLIINGYHDVNPEDARESLCRLLLSNYLPSRIELSRHAHGDVHIRDYIPPWLSTGLAQNFDPNLRAMNAVAGVRRWEKGRLMSVFAMLSYRSKNAEAKLDPLMASLFVSWLSGFKDGKGRFNLILKRLDDGEDVTSDWLTSLIPNSETAADIEEQWDYWLNGRRHVIYKPGIVTSDTINMLKDRLLLYPGNSGIPLDVNPGRMIRMADLIEMRDKEWVSLFCRRKSVELRLFAAGHGDKITVIVDAYCAFLVALAKDGNYNRLSDLLMDAKRSLREIENGYKEDDSR